VFGPPPVAGLGSAGGFKFIVEDRSGDNDLRKLQAQADRLIARGNAPSYRITDEGLEALRGAGAPEAVLGDLEEQQEKNFKELQMKGFGKRELAKIIDKDVPLKSEREKVNKLVMGHAVGQELAVQGLFTVFRANTPQLYVDVNRDQCQAMGVNPNEVFQTLQVYLGSYYVNDFNKFGRTWQVVVQAEGPFRNDPAEVKRLKVRSRNGDMVPLGAVLSIREIAGPILVYRYNMYPAAAVVGGTRPGYSTGEGIRAMERLADATLPQSMGYEWTEINFIQIDAARNVWNNLIFPLAVVFVFLVLAAQYESWALPLAVILVVPMCILGSLTGVFVTHTDVNIFTQIGFVVLVGLASKNAILIVEFARHQHQDGLARREATLAACRLRLRPILMTSFAFILGVVPLLTASGAGAEMRHSLGTAVFSGMLGVTLFGIFLTPVFFFVIESLVEAPLFSSARARQVGRAVRLALGVATLGLFWLPGLLVRLLQRPLAAHPGARSVSEGSAAHPHIAAPHGNGVAVGGNGAGTNGKASAADGAAARTTDHGLRTTD
jgi:multidrug efflux pump